MGERKGGKVAIQHCVRGHKAMRRFGLRLGGYDSRDFLYHQRTPSDLVSGSSRVIISHDIPVVNQGAIVPCCVSVCVSTCLEVMDSSEGVALSFMYNYYRARNYLDRLSSIDIRTGLDAAAAWGICRRDLHNVALDRNGALSVPSADADADADTRKIGYDPGAQSSAYERFGNGNRTDDWKNALRNGAPVIVGLFITDAYSSIQYTSNIHMSPSNSTSETGHAVTIMGFDDNKECNNLQNGAFFVRDSQGGGFAEKGYWWMPYDLVDSHFIFDSWTVHALA